MKEPMDSKKTQPLDLTVVIPVLNEARNLPGCLEALGKDLAAKVVVVDSGSTDETCRIAAEWGAEVIDFKWDGRFPKKRNWYLRNHTPETGWVFFLDADEYLTPEFKGELRERLSGESDCCGYWLNYSIYFLGKVLKGGYPMKKLALFRVGEAEYERIEEESWSKLDMEIHEHPVVEGPVGQISARIDHRDLRGVEHYVRKHNEYSSWEARRHVASKGAKDKTHLTFPQRVKYRLVETPLIGPVYFLGSFLLMGGFRDGARGLAFAIMKAGYFVQIYSKIAELKEDDRGEEAT